MSNSDISQPELEQEARLLRTRLAEIEKILQSPEISPAERAKTALQESEEKFSKAFNSNMMVMSITSLAEGRYLDVNEAFCQATGYSREEVIGKTESELDLLENEEVRDMIQSQIAENKFIRGLEINYFSREKQRREGLFSAYLIELSGDPYLLSSVIDITERNQALRDLDQAIHQLAQKNRELEELNSSKDKFFSIIAHDLRNPLTSFISFSDVLDDISSLDKDTFNRLSTEFRSSASYLLNLLDNLLTWARIQRGLITSDPFPLELNEVVQLCIRHILSLAQEKGIVIHNLISPEIQVFADYYMLDRTLHNLLSNSVKFSQAGGVVDITAEQNNGMVITSISDNGIGIFPESLGDLFKIGVKTSQAGTAGEKGTGLGLILCKEFIEKNKGKIWVESQPGQGSTFHFTLPKA
jgi:PAS domain S-box-containing protein